LHNYIVAGQGTAQETLDRVTQEHERIFTEAGLLKA
jgi:multiple sugar transport system substrate-binding protein